jgi:hypothetical protein
MLVDADGNAPPRRILVALPCSEMVHADFAYDLAGMVGYTQFTKPEWTLLLYHVKGTYLPRARAALANVALEQGCSHILWLDSDMRFPKDTLVRLMAHGQSIVAANYSTRQPPFLPTALDMQYQPVFSGEGLTDVRACGMGVMLTACEVFEKMGKPYFALGYNRKDDDYAGEDTYFCEQARKAGYRVLVDWSLSDDVAHCGGFTFTMDHARLTLDAAKAAGAE